MDTLKLLVMGLGLEEGGVLRHERLGDWESSPAFFIHAYVPDSWLSSPLPLVPDRSSTRGMADPRSLQAHDVGFGTVPTPCPRRRSSQTPLSY